MESTTCSAKYKLVCPDIKDTLNKELVHMVPFAPAVCKLDCLKLKEKLTTSVHCFLKFTNTLINNKE